jgi:hypothetical protein
MSDNAIFCLAASQATGSDQPLSRQRRGPSTVHTTIPSDLSGTFSLLESESGWLTYRCPRTDSTRVWTESSNQSPRPLRGGQNITSKCVSFGGDQLKKYQVNI